MNKIVTFFRESMIARILIPTGLILIIFGTIVFIINSNNRDYIKVDAIVSKTELVEDEHTDSDGNKVEATYKIYVKYTVEEKEYDELLGEVSGYKEGDKIVVYYNPNDPTQITQTKSLILPIVLIVTGISILIGGIISGINAIKKYNKMKIKEKEWENGK